MGRITSTVIMESDYNPELETIVELCKTPDQRLNLHCKNPKPAFEMEKENIGEICPILEIGKFVLNNWVPLKVYKEEDQEMFPISSDLDNKPVYKTSLAEFVLALSDKDRLYHENHTWIRFIKKMLSSSYYSLERRKVNEVEIGRSYLVGKGLLEIPIKTKVERIMDEVQKLKLNDREKKGLAAKLCPVKL